MRSDNLLVMYIEWFLRTFKVILFQDFSLLKIDSLIRTFSLWYFDLNPLPVINILKSFPFCCHSQSFMSFLLGYIDLSSFQKLLLPLYFC